MPSASTTGYQGDVREQCDHSHQQHDQRCFPVSPIHILHRCTCHHTERRAKQHLYREHQKRYRGEGADFKCDRRSEREVCEGGQTDGGHVLHT